MIRNYRPCVSATVYCRGMESVCTGYKEKKAPGFFESLPLRRLLTGFLVFTSVADYHYGGNDADDDNSGDGTS